MNALHVLQAAAITLVFTQGSIFEYVREHGPKLWQRFARCALCVGVWVGMAPAFPPLVGASHEVYAWFSMLGQGACTGVLALLIRHIIALAEAAESDK